MISVVQLFFQQQTNEHKASKMCRRAKGVFGIRVYSDGVQLSTRYVLGETEYADRSKWRTLLI